MVSFLEAIPADLGKPEAILVVSAHWEAAQPTVTGGAAPSLVYDYFGFPQEAYQVEYPAPGAPELATRIQRLLKDNGISGILDNNRGFDHGLFVPLKLMYPEATIPCVQLSLVQGLDPAEHIRIGKVLSGLRAENILTIGSGFSFHNMKAFSFSDRAEPDEKNDSFDQWLRDTCTHPALTPEAREAKLTAWEQAEHARYCHPREEHLLPLHVCCGMAGAAGQVVFNDFILGKRATALLWR
jgi:aromatic ring-opening dioxygenase catalytic subunit (LigB family)